MRTFAAMLFVSLALAALFFAFVLLSDAHALRATQIRYLCPDRYHGGPVPATKWNVTHLVCIRNGR